MNRKQKGYIKNQNCSSATTEKHCVVTAILGSEMNEFVYVKDSNGNIWSYVASKTDAKIGDSIICRFNENDELISAR